MPISIRLVRAPTAASSGNGERELLGEVVHAEVRAVGARPPRRPRRARSTAAGRPRPSAPASAGRPTSARRRGTQSSSRLNQLGAGERHSGLATAFDLNIGNAGGTRPPGVDARTGRDGGGAVTLPDALADAVTDVRTRATDRLAYAHDASHYLLTPAGGGGAARRRPRSAALFRRRQRSGRAADLPLRRHQPVRAGGHRRRSSPTPAGTSAQSRCSTTAPGCGCSPGATVRAGQRPPGPPRPQARPRPGQRGRLHASAGSSPTTPAGMACGTEQNTYRTLESLVARAAQRHRRRHRRRRRRRAAARTTNPSCTQGSRGCATASAATPQLRRARSAQQFSMKNTMGYGAQRVPRPRPARSTSSPTSSSAARARSAFIAEATSAPCRCCATPRTGAARLRRPAARPRARCPRWSAPARRRSSCWTPPRCAWRQTDPQADALLRGLSGATGRRRCSSSTRARPAAAADARRRRGRRRARGPARSPARARSRPTRARGPRCGTSARASTPRSRAPARRGTTALLEDVVVPVPALLPTPASGLHRAVRPARLRATSVIFGHAKDGNIHFMLTERLRRTRPARPLPAVHRGHGRRSSSATAARSRPSTAPAGSWRRSCAASTATSSTR